MHAASLFEFSKLANNPYLNIVNFLGLIKGYNDTCTCLEGAAYTKFLPCHSSRFNRQPGR